MPRLRFPGSDELYKSWTPQPQPEAPTAPAPPMKPPPPPPPLPEEDGPPPPADEQTAGNFPPDKYNWYDNADSINSPVPKGIPYGGANIPTRDAGAPAQKLAAATALEKAGLPADLLALAPLVPFEPTPGAGGYYDPSDNTMALKPSARMAGRPAPAGGAIHESLHAFENALTPEEHKQLTDLIAANPPPNGAPTRHHPPGQEGFVSGVTAYFDYPYSGFYEESAPDQAILGQAKSPIPLPIQEFIRAKAPEVVARSGNAPQSIKPPNTGDAGLTAPLLQQEPDQAPGDAVQPQADEQKRRQQFIKDHSAAAERWSKKTGVPASYFLAIGASETNWGAAPGLFGIKGSSPSGTSSNLATHEIVNGQRVETRDNFATYSNDDEAFTHLFGPDVLGGPRYKGAMDYLAQTKDPMGWLQRVNQAGYATDDNWHNNVLSIANQINGGDVGGSGEAPASSAARTGYGQVQGGSFSGVQGTPALDAYRNRLMLGTQDQYSAELAAPSQPTEPAPASKPPATAPPAVPQQIRPPQGGTSAKDLETARERMMVIDSWDSYAPPLREVDPETGGVKNGAYGPTTPQEQQMAAAEAMLARDETNRTAPEVARAGKEDYQASPDSLRGRRLGTEKRPDYVDVPFNENPLAAILTPIEMARDATRIPVVTPAAEAVAKKIGQATRVGLKTADPLGVQEAVIDAVAGKGATRTGRNAAGTLAEGLVPTTGFDVLLDLATGGGLVDQGAMAAARVARRRLTSAVLPDGGLLATGLHAGVPTGGNLEGEVRRIAEGSGSTARLGGRPGRTIEQMQETLAEYERVKKLAKDRPGSVSQDRLDEIAVQEPRLRADIAEVRAYELQHPGITYKPGTVASNRRRFDAEAAAAAPERLPNNRVAEDAADPYGEPPAAKPLPGQTGMFGESVDGAGKVVSQQAFTVTRPYEDFGSLMKAEADVKAEYPGHKVTLSKDEGSKGNATFRVEPPVGPAVNADPPRGEMGRQGEAFPDPNGGAQAGLLTEGTRTAIDTAKLKPATTIERAGIGVNDHQHRVWVDPQGNMHEVASGGPHPEALTEGRKLGEAFREGWVRVGLDPGVGNNHVLYVEAMDRAAGERAAEKVLNTLSPEDRAKTRLEIGTSNPDNMADQAIAVNTSADAWLKDRTTGAMPGSPAPETPRAATVEAAAKEAPKQPAEAVERVLGDMSKSRELVKASDVTYRPSAFQARDVDPGLPYNERNVQRLLDAWDDNLFEAPVAVPDPDAPGKYIAFVGHHRTEAWKRKYGDDKLMPLDVVNADIRDPSQLAAIQKQADASNTTIKALNFRELIRTAQNVEARGGTIEDAARQMGISRDAAESLMDSARLGQGAIDRVVAEPALEPYIKELGRGMRVYDLTAEDANGWFARLADSSKASRPTPTVLRETVDKFGKALADVPQGSLFEASMFKGDRGGILKMIDENARIATALQKEINATERAKKGALALAGDDPRKIRAAQSLTKAGDEKIAGLRDRLRINEEDIAAALKGEDLPARPLGATATGSSDVGGGAGNGKAPPAPPPPGSKADFADEPVNALIDALESAKPAREELVRARSEELGRRRQEFMNKLLDDNVPPEQAFRRARQSLKGKLAEPPGFDVPDGLAQQARDLHREIVRQTRNSTISDFTGNNASEGLNLLLAGIEPRPFEVEALGHVFGPRLQQAIERMGQVWKVRRTVEKVIESVPIEIPIDVTNGEPLSVDILAGMLKKNLPEGTPNDVVRTVAQQLMDGDRLMISQGADGKVRVAISGHRKNALGRAVDDFNNFDDEFFGHPDQLVPPEQPGLEEGARQLSSQELVKAGDGETLTIPTDPTAPTRYPRFDAASTAERERLSERWQSLTEKPSMTEAEYWQARKDVKASIAKGIEFPPDWDIARINKYRRLEAALGDTPSRLDAAAVGGNVDAGLLPGPLLEAGPTPPVVTPPEGPTLNARRLNRGLQTPMEPAGTGRPQAAPKSAGSREQLEFTGSAWKPGDGRMIDGKWVPTGFMEHFWNLFSNIVGAPKTAMSMLDRSGYMRQGGVLVRHGGEFFDGVAKTMVIAEDSIDAARLAHTLGVDAKHIPNAEDVMVGINNGKWAKERQQAGLVVEKWGPNAPPSLRNENFTSRLFDWVPGAKMSERAFSVFLNKLRADVFDNIAEKWEREAVFDMTKEGAAKRVAHHKALADYLNAATGHGNLGAFEDAAGVLSRLWFSPRNVAARFQVIGQLMSPTTPWLVRKEMAKDLVVYVGAGVTLLSMAHLSGLADVELDPRSADFGKIKIGHTRIDLWGGYQQIARTVATLYTGETMDSSGNLHSADRLEVIGRYLRNKLSPSAGVGVNLLDQTDATGQPFDVRDLISLDQAKGFAPLFLQDIIEGVKEHGAWGLALAPVTFMGFGASTYATFGEQRDQQSKEMFVKDTAGNTVPRPEGYNGPGVPFKDLLPRQQQAVNDSKTMTDLVAQREPSEYRKARDATMNPLQQRQDEAEKLFTEGKLKEPLPDIWRTINDERRGARAALEAAFAKDFDQEHQDAFHKALDGFFDPSLEKSSGGVFDFDATELARQDYLAKLPQREREWVEDALNLSREKQSPLRRQYLDYIDERKKAGYFDVSPTDPQRAAKLAELDRKNPKQDALNWFFKGGLTADAAARVPTLASGKGVDEALKLAANRPVKMADVDRPINQDAKSLQAWKDTGKQIDWFLHEAVPQNQEAFAQKRYKKSYDKLTKDEQSQARADVRADIRKDPKMKAALVWWGIDDSIEKDSPAYKLLTDMWTKYGKTPPKPGAELKLTN